MSSGMSLALRAAHDFRTPPDGAATAFEALTSTRERSSNDGGLGRCASKPASSALTRSWGWA